MDGSKVLSVALNTLLEQSISKDTDTHLQYSSMQKDMTGETLCSSSVNASNIFSTTRDSSLQFSRLSAASEALHREGIKISSAIRTLKIRYYLMRSGATELSVSLRNFDTADVITWDGENTGWHEHTFTVVSLGASVRYYELEFITEADQSVIPALVEISNLTIERL